MLAKLAFLDSTCRGRAACPCTLCTLFGQNNRSSEDRKTLNECLISTGLNTPSLGPPVCFNSGPFAPWQTSTNVRVSSAGGSGSGGSNAALNQLFIAPGPRLTGINFIYIIIILYLIIINCVFLLMTSNAAHFIC